MEYRADEDFTAARGWDAPTSRPADAIGLEPVEPEPLARSHFGPVLVAVAALLWVGGALFFTWPVLRQLDALGLIGLVGGLSAVPILLAVLWLLAMRSSDAEARRFGDVARAMRAEAASLERSVGRLSGALDANRASLAEQAASLQAIGDAAAERLGALGRSVGQEVGRATAQAQTLAEVSAQAQSDLSALLAALPQAQRLVEETGRLLDRAGQSAFDHTQGLAAELVSLAEHGREAERVAEGAAGRLAVRMAEVRSASDAASERLDASTERMSGLVDASLARAAGAVEQANKRLGAQGDQLAAMLSAHQASLDHAARASVDALAERITGIDVLIDDVTMRLDSQRASGDLIVEQLRTGIIDVDRRLEALHVQGGERAQMVAASISALGESADAMTEALKAGEAMATRTIGTTESLLIALDAASREIDETLPEALTRLDTRIAGTKKIVAEAKPELLALVTAAESTHDAIEAIAGVVQEQRRTLDQLSGTLLDTLSGGRAKADALGHTVEEAIERTHRFAEDAAPRLTEALLRVRDSASHAADQARDALTSIIPQAVERLERAGADALRRATAGTVQREVEALAGAADEAVEAAARAAERVAREAQRIADQTAIIESRLEEERTEREESDRAMLGRRVATLIDALNSAAIDVSKMLSPEVADTAWAAYLKGDRGVFTRRAVRLLDGTQARDVARLYDGDPRFREEVNRYIHDFEGMLRAILAQPEGSSLSITLLSSDMGKLYVALAQAIERLR